MTTEPKRNQIAAISVGDLNGIGLEVILKSLSDDRILEMITPVLFASQEVVKAKRKQLELSHMQHGMSDPWKRSRRGRSI